MKKLIWFLIIAGAIYYGYNNWLPAVNNTNDVVDAEVEENTNKPVTWLTYDNNSYANYSIQYPSDWNITNNSEETIFVSSDDLDNVVISLKKNGVTNNNGIQTIKEIAGQQVLIIEGEDPDDGSPAKFIFFNLSNDKKLEVRGFGSIFDKMLNTLVISSEQLDNTNNTDTNDTKTEGEDTNEEAAEDVNTEEENDANTDNTNEDDTDTTNNADEEDTSKAEEEFIVKIYYQKDAGDNCESVVGLEKQIDTRYNTDEVNSLVTLTLGLDTSESAQGYSTSIPYGTRLRSLEIQSGIATADFNAALNEGGGSCDMTARRAQITETLIQFPDIEQVIITVDGSADTALQP
jgi:spore germination protein GerM